MTLAEGETVHRVLLGIGETRESATVMDTATRVAGKLGAAVECLVVTREDFLSAAAMPFARTFVSGGLSMPMTTSAMEGYFRRLAYAVEQELTERCRAASLQWHLQQQSGTLLGQIASAVQQGDVVVVGWRDLHMAAKQRASTLRALLQKAAAVVLPGLALRPRGPAVLLPGLGDEGTVLAHRMVAAIAAGQRIEQLSVHLPFRHQASLVIGRLGTASFSDDEEFLAELDRMGASAVLLPPSISSS